MHTRREFLKSSSALAVAAPFTSLERIFSPVQRKFRMCLNPGAIGVSADQMGTLDLAIKYGYEAIIAKPDELLQYSDEQRAALLEKMKANNITWGSSGLPVDFRKDADTYIKGVEALKAQAPELEKVGATRMNTWIMPSHNTLRYRDNFDRHARRLGECADILADHGVRLGLEYVGPKTLMNRSRYPFMRTMSETRDLIDHMGRSNVGLVLDSFHWYCAEDTYDDILSLSNEDIVTVDLNDARSDLSRDEQIDGTRELPLGSGVIDLKTFLGALVEVGYDGPVRAEPFNKKLIDMDNEAATQTTYKAMRAAFKLVG